MTGASEPTSFSLLTRARSNDQRAWRQLVHVYGPLVHRWCKRSGLKDEDVADVFQETFRAVSMNLSSFAPRRQVGSFRSWLRTIVRTKVTDHFRRQRNQPVGRGGTDAQMQLANLVDPDSARPRGRDSRLAFEADEEADDENALVVQRAMELIRPEFSETNWNAFCRVALDGERAVDVANKLDVSPQSVRQANYRIRRRLRLVLEGLVE